MLERYQDKNWNIDWEGTDQEVSPDIDGKNKLRTLSRKEELNEWKWWRSRHGMTEIEGGFCPKLDPRLETQDWMKKKTKNSTHSVNSPRRMAKYSPH